MKTLLSFLICWQMCVSLTAQVSSQQEFIEEYIAKIKKENIELALRIDALEEQVASSKAREQQLQLDINSLSQENDENLTEHLKLVERVKERIVENSLSAEETFSLFAKLTKEHSKTKASLEQKVRALEEKYKRTLAVNIFKSECKCIEATDDSIRLLVRLTTNEVKDEADGLFIAAGQPLYQRVKVRIRIKALRDENAKEGPVTIRTDKDEEYVEVEHFFDEHPIEVVFRSSDKVFRDGFFQNRPGRMVEILTEAGVVSSYLYLPKLAEACKDPLPR